MLQLKKARKATKSFEVDLYENGTFKATLPLDSKEVKEAYKAIQKRLKKR